MATNNMFPDCMNSECLCFTSNRFKAPLLYNKDDPFQYVAHTQKWIQAYLDELNKHINKDRFFLTNNFDTIGARDIKYAIDHHINTVKFFEKMFILQKVNGKN
jgi:predicted metal-dependent hydrolase